MADRCVFSVSDKGVEFCAPTFQALLHGAKLAPRPDPPAPQRIDPKDDTVESFIEAVFSVPPRRE